MNSNLKIFVFLIVFTLTSPLGLFAQDEMKPAKGGFFKARTKKRWMEKQQNPPETNATTDDVITKPGDYTFKISSSGIDRYYMVHIPAKYSVKMPAPLIVAMHGAKGNMSIQASDKAYKLISKSDKEGFIVAFPNGYSKFPSGKMATWNAGKCCALARDNEIDDVKFINEIVEYIKKQFKIDAKKVFAIGMSNGGMMAYRLACDSAKLFKAIASVTGTDITKSCKPSKAVSILHIHAKDDELVLFKGGKGKGASPDKSDITDFPPVNDVIKKWTKLNECSSTPKKIIEKPKAYCELYSNCSEKTEVQLCVTENGGHTWPGGEGHSFNKKAAPPSVEISATDVMWDFFKNK